MSFLDFLKRNLTYNNQPVGIIALRNDGHCRLYPEVDVGNTPIHEMNVTETEFLEIVNHLMGPVKTSLSPCQAKDEPSLKGSLDIHELQENGLGVSVLYEIDQFSGDIFLFVVHKRDIIVRDKMVAAELINKAKALKADMIIMDYASYHVRFIKNFRFQPILMQSIPTWHINAFVRSVFFKDTVDVIRVANNPMDVTPYDEVSIGLSCRVVENGFIHFLACGNNTDVRFILNPIGISQPDIYASSDS